MERVRWCRLCRGFGVRATPVKYRLWRAKLAVFSAYISRKEKDEKVIAARILAFSSAMTKGHEKCSFCNGTGGFTGLKK